MHDAVLDPELDSSFSYRETPTKTNIKYKSSQSGSSVRLLQKGKLCLIGALVAWPAGRLSISL